MNVNQNAYGMENEWGKFFSQSDIPDDNTPLIATYPDGHSLRYGVESGALTFNDFIDNSIAFVGVDNNFSMLNQTFFQIPEIETGDVLTKADLRHITAIERNGVNPMCLLSGTGGATNSMQYATQSNYLTKFWAFKMKNVASSLDSSLIPITNIPMTLVWGIGVVCGGESPDTSSYYQSVKTFDLYTYCHYKQNNEKFLYEDNPYIFGVYIIPFFRNNKEISDPELKNVTYRSVKPGLQSYGNLYFRIMNKFETCTVPFPENENSDAYNILTYTQTSCGGNVSSPKYTNFYSGNGNLLSIANYNPVWIFGNNGAANECPLNSILLMNDTFLNVRITRVSATRNVASVIQWAEITGNFQSVDFFELWCKEQCAYTGGFFTDSFDVAIHCPVWNVNNTYIGTLDAGGVTHGDYTEGLDNEKQKQYDWDDWKNSPYSPSGRPQGSDSEQESDKYSYNSPTFAFDTGNYYAMTSARMQSLMDWINKITNPDAQFAVNADDEHYSYEQLSQEMRKLFNGQYPEDMLLSLTFYPFSITDNSQGTLISNNSPIRLGSIATTQKTWFGTTLQATVGAELIHGNSCFVFTTSAYPVNEYYGDFRDYPPYTSMSISIPYHSTIPLEVGEWYGHSLSTRMFVDIITGASTTIIERDGIPVTSVDGQVGTPVQLITRNVGQYVASLTSSAQLANALKIQGVKNITNGVKSGLSIATSAATFNPVKPSKSINGALDGLFGLWNTSVSNAETAKGFQNVQIDLAHNQAGFSVISQSSPTVALCFENAPRLLIRRPVTLPEYNPSVYAETVGYACMIQGKIAELSGYSVFSNADLSGIIATENDKAELLSLLQSGVYI